MGVKRQWQTGYSPRPPTSPYRSQSLHAGWPPVCSSIFQVFLTIGPVVLPLWVVKNRPSPLLWPLAYTTACTTVQAVTMTPNSSTAVVALSQKAWSTTNQDGL